MNHRQTEYPLRSRVLYRALLATAALCCPAGALADDLTFIENEVTIVVNENSAEPKDARVFTRQWMMSKVADGKEYAITSSKKAGGTLAASVASSILKGGSFADVARSALGAVVDSYVPGFSSVLGLSGAPDPFAQHAAQILDRIELAEENVLAEIGRLWTEIRQNRELDIQMSYETLRSELLRYRTEMTNWMRLNDPERLRQALDSMNGFVIGAEQEIMRPGPESSYPYLHHLETMTFIVQAYLEYAPDYQYYAAANSYGVSTEPTYTIASPGTLAKIDADAHATTLRALENSLGRALDFAADFSNDNPLMQRVRWMFGDTHADYYGTCRGADYPDELDAHGLMAVALGYEEWLPYSYFVRRDDVTSGVTEEVKEYCVIPAVPRDNISPDATVYLSTYDGMVREFRTREEVIMAHREGLYNAMLRISWAPYRVFLDRWWSVLKRHGLRSGDRPYLALDRDLDDYIANGSGTALGPVLTVLAGAVAEELSYRQRSKFVGYALENGTDDLFLTLFGLAGWDPLTTSGRYPLHALEQYVEQTRRSKQDTQAFARRQFAAKLISIM